MDADFVDCPEVAGKQIARLRIFRDAGEGTELQIDFEDGTAFNCSFNVAPTIEACIIRPGVGVPEVLHQYDFK